MSKNRNIADLLNSNGDVKPTALDGADTPIGRRNLIINGNMEVNQRGTSSITSSINPVFTVDRWLIAKNDTVNFDVSVNNFSLGQTNVPQGKKYISYTLNSALNGLDFVTLEQRIEDLEIFSGQTVTLSFWARASQNHTFDADNLSGISNPQYVVNLMQYFGVGGSSPVNTPFTQSIQLTTSWTKYVYTITVPSIAGKTFGTDPHARLHIIDMADDDVGITVDVAQVQLELGSVATPFEHRSYGEELALCQRYYQYHGNNSQMLIGWSYCGTNEHCWGSFQFPKMRVAPTATYTGNAHSNCAGDITVSGIATTPSSIEYMNVAPTSLPAGYFVSVANLWLDAEL